MSGILRSMIRIGIGRLMGMLFMLRYWRRTRGKKKAVEVQ